MQKSKASKKPFPIKIKPAIFTLSLLFIIGAIIYGIIGLSSVLPSGFSAEVFFTPLRWIQQILLWPTIVFAILSALLIIRGATNQRLWFLLPTGIIITGIYWLTMNIMVINMVEKLLEK